MDWNKAAARLRKIADKHKREGTRDFADEPDMIKMYADDAKDLYRIAALLEKGRINGAVVRAQDLDTACRDLIPARIYDALYAAY